VNGSLNCACISRHIIPHLCDRLTILTAAISQLPGKCVSVLHVCDTHLGKRILDSEPSRRDILIDRVHLGKLVITEGANPAVDAIKLVDNTGGIKATLNIASSSALAITATSAISASAPAKQCKQNDQNSPAIVSAPAIIAVVVSGYGRNIGQTRCAHVEHRMILLEK
jgi:hypothetical protein